MGTLRHGKQILLFLAAVLVPSLTLVLFTTRIVRQEKELSVKRLADDRERRAQEIGREILLRLERMKLEEAQKLEASLARPDAARPGRSEVVMLGFVEDGRLILPWERSSSSAAVRSPAARDPRVAESIRSGERAEFETKDLGSAAEMFRRALALGGNGQEYVRLLLARVLAKSGKTAEAFKHYDSLLALPAGEKDDDGIPLFLYAADRLSSSRDHSEKIIARIGADLKEERWMPPQEMALINSILASVETTTASDEARREASGLRNSLRPLSDEALRLVALQRSFPAYGSRLETNGSGSGESVWEMEPKGDWLLGLGSLGPERRFLLVVDIASLSASLRLDKDFRQAFPEEIRLTSADGQAGENLGSKLRGLNVVFPGVEGASILQGASLTRPFYLLTMAAVVIFATLGGYLLWRDVRREMRLAELRSQFASSVSHELKTPLTAIRMFAETIRMGRIGGAETRNEYLDTIVNESERLSRLLNNVLDVSKIEQGTKIYRPLPQPLAPIVRTAARTMEYPLRQKGFVLDVEIDESLPEVRVDADALEQALLNLIGNAIKYSGDSRRIGLRLARRGGCAVVEVRDKGVGIDPRDRERIFERFYRVPSKENRATPGTGLGLSLVAHFAQAHGGRVEVEETPGGGSTFTLHLPLEGGA